MKGSSKHVLTTLASLQFGTQSVSQLDQLLFLTCQLLNVLHSELQLALKFDDNRLARASLCHVDVHPVERRRRLVLSLESSSKPVVFVLKLLDHYFLLKKLCSRFAKIEI